MHCSWVVYGCHVGLSGPGRNSEMIRQGICVPVIPGVDRIPIGPQWHEDLLTKALPIEICSDWLFINITSRSKAFARSFRRSMDVPRRSPLPVTTADECKSASITTPIANVPKSRRSCP